MECHMTTPQLEHPPVHDKAAISISLTKRPEGASQMEATQAGGGTRLAAQIGKLKDKGHCFRTQREGRERYSRYWWEGYNPDGLGYLRQISDAPHIHKSDSASPPLPPSKRTTALSSKGGHDNA